MTVNAPVVFQYQRALDAFRREGGSSPLLKRMSELISLLDLTTTLNSSLSGAEILDAALLIVMGELPATRGALFVRGESGGGYRVQASRGLPAGAPAHVELEPLGGPDVIFRRQGTYPGVFEAFGKLVPVTVSVDDLSAHSVLQTPTAPWALLPRIGLGRPPKQVDTHR